MAYMNRIAIQDENGYREEIWDLDGKGWQKMEDTLDEQVAEGIIFGWWIDS